jgi:hypothetical protein
MEGLMTQATTINRRRALAVVAAVPAAAALGVPALASAPDPIFAAIAAHKALVKKTNRLYDKLDLAEHNAKETHGRRPWSLIAWRNYSAIGGAEIDDRRELFLRHGADPTQIEQEYQDAKRRESEAVRAGREWDKKAGIASLRQEYERSHRAVRAAARLMAKTKPTTAAGAAAMVDYARRDIEDGVGPEWPMIALKTVAASLARAGRLA